MLPDVWGNLSLRALLLRSLRPALEIEGLHSSDLARSYAPMTSPHLPGELFHYTSAAGALGILREGVIRASMLHYMNDGQEFGYAIDLARAVLREVEEAREGEEDFVGACLAYLDSVSRLAVFAISLSENGDLLSQWRAYAPPEGGYAIGFRATDLQKIAASQGFRLVPCEYDPGRQMTLMKPVVSELLGTVQKLGFDASTTAIHDAFTSRFAAVAATLKHPSFSEEKEWRLVAGPTSLESAGYVAKQTLIVPFLPLSLAGTNPFPVSRVIVGPHRYPDLASRSIRFMTSGALGWPIRVDTSKTPYRVIG